MNNVKARPAPLALAQAPAEIPAVTRKVAHQAIPMRTTGRGGIVMNSYLSLASFSGSSSNRQLKLANASCETEFR
jgi:hypothetical protein